MTLSSGPDPLVAICLTGLVEPRPIIGSISSVLGMGLWGTSCSARVLVGSAHYAPRLASLVRNSRRVISNSIVKMLLSQSLREMFPEESDRATPS